MSEIERLANLFRAVVTLRERIFSWEDDRKLINNNNSLILFAIDTNIVKFFTTNSNNEYARVIPKINEKNNEESLILLSRVLSDFIFFKLTKEKFPLIVLRTTDEEIRRVYNAIFREANQEVKFAEEQLSSAHKRKLLGHPIKQLEEIAPILVRFLKGTEGHASEFRRFSTLVSNKCLVTLDYFLENKFIKDKAMSEALDDPKSMGINGTIQERILVEQWFSRLTEHSTDSKPTINIYDDAKVLARIEWINRWLNIESRKLVFITGDKSILNAAKTYSPPNHPTDTFLDLYLRHPQSYIDAAVQSSESDIKRKTNKLSDILYTFINHFDFGEQAYRNSLSRISSYSDEKMMAIVKPALERYPSLVYDFNNHWQQYIQYHLLDYPFESKSFEKDDEYINIFNSAVDALDKYKFQLNKRKLETWESCFNVATEGGLLLKKKSKARLAPVITYASFPVARKFVASMLEDDLLSRDSSAYKSQLNDLLTEDSSRYTYYLAYAVLYAAYGNWQITTILADQALEIANKTQNKNISGREATYLRAVALRYAASSVEDLIEIIPLLDQTRKFLDQDRKNRPYLLAGEIRFRAEYLSFYLACYQFEYYLSQKIPKLIRETLPDFDLLINKIDKLLMDTTDTLLSETDENEIWVTRNVERRQLKNYFTALELKMVKENTIEIPPKIKEYFIRFDKNLESKASPQIDISYLVQTSFKFAKWLYYRNSENKSSYNKTRKELEQWLNDNNIDQFKVSPFDKPRFLELRKFINRY